MTIEETSEIMDILKSAYPNFYKGQSEKEQLKTTKLWAAMFSDDDSDIVAAAVKAFIITDEKSFPPSIGVIKNKIADIANPDAMTEYEAWGLVAEAISDGYYGAHEEFSKLPPVLQKIVGSPNQLRTWSLMESKDLHTVVASNFMRSYRVMAAREREYSMLPGDVKYVISEISERFKMPELPEPMTEFEINERRNEIARQLTGGRAT